MFIITWLSKETRNHKPYISLKVTLLIILCPWNFQISLLFSNSRPRPWQPWHGITHIAGWSQASNVQCSVLYNVLYCTDPRHPIYLVWAARPRTRPLIGMLSLSLSRIFCIFQFPRPAVTRSSHSITISHQKTDTAQLLPTIALLFDKRKLFTNSPGNWKTATDSSQTSDRGGKGTHVKTKKLVQELASSQNSDHHTLANLETGQTRGRP